MNFTGRPDSDQDQCKFKLDKITSWSREVDMISNPYQRSYRQVLNVGKSESFMDIVSFKWGIFQQKATYKNIGHFTQGPKSVGQAVRPCVQYLLIVLLV